MTENEPSNTTWTDGTWSDTADQPDIPADQPWIPALRIERLVIVTTGSVSAADLPFWVTWLRTYYPRLETQVVLTPAASRFVTEDALAGRLNGKTRHDRWPSPSATALHVELAEWADAFLIHPCTFDYLSRLAAGRGNSPSLLAIQCATAPIVVAPALPPGGVESDAYRRHLEALEDRENIAVLPPVRGVSQSTGRRDAWAPALFPMCIAMVEQARHRLEKQDVAECSRRSSQ